jgi:TetR/AcrR family transcriptional regulator, transcriptional repressor for nem operon
MSTSTGTTKERILDAAEELMLAKSFHSVGLNEILSAVKVPKGSFYHYFESKEQFGVELIRHYVSEGTTCKRRMLLSEELDANPLERLLAFLNGSIAHLVEKDCKQCCLVLKLGIEVASMSDDMRAVLGEGMQEWRSIYEKVIREGQQKSVIRQELDPAATAALLHDYWMGALQRMLIERSPAPLKAVIGFARQYLSV